MDVLTRLPEGKRADLKKPTHEEAEAAFRTIIDWPGSQPVSQSKKSSDQFSDLMCAAQSGDNAAYTALLRAVTPQIRKAVRRQHNLVGPESVEDIVQDVLMSMHAARASFDPARPFMPWVHAIVRNRLTDAARRQIRRSSNEIAVDNLPEISVDEGANLESGRQHESEPLRQAMRDLPRGQREALEKVKLSEMSLSEASTVTGMSVGALKTSVHRAMASLRTKLASA